MVLSCWARTSLRYRIARMLLMEHLKSQRHGTRIEVQKKIWFGAVPLARCAMKGAHYSPNSSPHQRPSWIMESKGSWRDFGGGPDGDPARWVDRAGKLATDGCKASSLSVSFAICSESIFVSAC